MDFMTVHSVGNGMSSSQLTFTPSFFRGVAKNHQPVLDNVSTILEDSHNNSPCGQKIWRRL